MLATRLILMCVGATAASRIGGFPAPHEPLDDGGLRKAQGLAQIAISADRIVASPALAAQETAAALGASFQTGPALADIDYGVWSGKSLAEIEASDTNALMAWLGDPTAGTPGGETMAAAQARIAPWLSQLAPSDSIILAITHPTIIRLCLAQALALPVRSTLHIDIAPLSTTILSYNRQWRLQELRRA